MKFIISNVSKALYSCLVVTLRKRTRHDHLNFGRFLMSFPGGIEFERNASPMRDIEL